LTSPRTLGVNFIFLGAATIARQQLQNARDLSHRKMHQDEYKADLERYGGELTLAEANRRLAADANEIREFLEVQQLDGPRGSEARQLTLDPRWDHNDPNSKRLFERKLIEDSPVSNYLEFGEVAQLIYGDKLPTARLWVHWRDYVIGCVPDGVATNYVYEFRATTKMSSQTEEQALRQAHLYSYAFKRPRFKVQIAQFRLPRNPFPLKVRDLPKPEISTTLKNSTEEDFTRIMSEFDKAFRGAQ